MPIREYSSMSNAVAALAEPARRRILDEVRDRERSVGDLVHVLALPQPSVSKHLRALRDAGLVTVRPEANRRYYRADPAPLAELDEWLTPYRRFWGERLDALERHLDEMEA
jgi:DNA-binding transcriptional ArsR family regulator